ncbi:diacylglycerol kinase [Niallia nealsonii]|uniref:Diacylglycerol kinase n=1 Tax=Niallia nealsonii TaxID=115979 RepID=A0A2N0YX04_9BACI|nr:diacylglycerol kinase family protein [Niallia nealsonii]PKG21786.1 diacylglycerol kinase [Niallia nealsonii]
MSLGLKDKGIRNNLFSSFRFALSGIVRAVKKERNLKFHLIISSIIIFLGFYYQVSAVNWMMLAIAMGLVITMEMMNTAIERVVDLVTKDFHPLAKEAKDIAAGAVLVAAVVSVVIGLIIFLPKIVDSLF